MAAIEAIPPKFRRLPQVHGTRRVDRLLRSLRFLFGDKTALIGASLVTGLVLVAIVGPVLVEHAPAETDTAHRLEGPSSEYILGTDHLGRDLLSRIVHGARLSIGSTVVTALGVSVIGTVIGLVAGYAGGLIDSAISRIVDVLLAFPGFLLALALVGLFGPSLRNVMISLIIVSWAGYARVVRSAVMVTREEPYVEAARSLGASHQRIVRRHVFRNIIGPIVVLTTLDMGYILLSLSSLSFLGLGVQPPTAEWGAMLSVARNYMGQSTAMMLLPGMAIFLMVLGFNLVGDGLRDYIDPKMGRSGAT